MTIQRKQARYLRKGILLALTTTAITSFYFPANNAIAQQAEAEINIPKGNLDKALREYGRQTGRQVSFIPSNAQKKKTSGTASDNSAEAAQDLLNGTGLTYDVDDNSDVTVFGTAAGIDLTNMDLDPIVVVGNTISRETVGISVVDTETIDRLQAGTVAELLTDLPGVDLDGSARPQGHSINMWGFADQEDIAIRIDGALKTFEKYRQGTVFIEPDLIKRAVVKKGSFSPRTYGAFGGSVELTTKSASDMLRSGENIGAYVKSGYGDNGEEWTNTGAVYGRHDASGAELLVSLTKRENGKYRLADDQELNLSSGEQYAGHFKGSITRGDHSLELSGAMTRSDRVQPYDTKRGQITPSSYLIRRYGYDQALRRLSVQRKLDDQSLSAKYNYNPENDLINTTVNLNYSHTKQHDKRLVDNIYASASLGGNESELSYDNYFSEVFNEATFKIMGLDTTFSAGVQARLHERGSIAYVWSDRKKPTRNHGYFQPWNLPEGTQKTLSAWTEYQVDFGNGLQITPGLRYDYVISKGKGNLASDYNNPAKGHDYGEVTHQGFSPNLNVFYQANRNISLFGDVAYKMRAPLLDEIYEVGTTKASATQLNAERVFSTRLGGATSFDDVIFDGDNFTARFQAYRNQVSHDIEKLFGTPNNDIYRDNGQLVPSYHNLRGYFTQGLEIEAYYDWKYLYAGASLSVSEGKHKGSLRDKYGSSQPVYDIAPNKLVTQVGLKIPKADLIIGWKGTFVDNQYEVPTDGLYSPYPASDGYGIHDAYISWTPSSGQFEGLKARLTVQNMFDRKYKPYFSGFTGKGRTIKTSLSYQF